MSMRIQVTPGERYGRLTVAQETTPHTSPGGSTFRRFTCVCDCGNAGPVRLRNLRSGNTASCGCARRKHNKSSAGTYSTWEGMRQRCLNPRSQYYSRYGGRGITVCDRWRDFGNFLADMGERPEGLTLERVDNNKGYSKENCRWATRRDQARNRCDTVLVTCRGETMCLTDWASRLGVHRDTIKSRLAHGWSIEAALSTPSLGRGNRRSITREFRGTSK